MQGVLLEERPDSRDLRGEARVEAQPVGEEDGDELGDDGARGGELRRVGGAVEGGGDVRGEQEGEEAGRGQEGGVGEEEGVELLEEGGGVGPAREGELQRVEEVGERDQGREALHQGRAEGGGERGR